MQLFRRDKRDDEAKAEARQTGQPNLPASWYENGEPARQPEPVYTQPVVQPQSPVPPPAPRAETIEQTRSVPAMSNIARENLPYPDLPVQGGGSRQAQPTGQATVIDAQSHFTGNYRSDSDLIIEGNFEGEIECNGTVTVAENATLSATVKARNVVIAGSANGEITCDERFTVRGTGEMRGKAQAATLVVEEGAFFEGEFRMGGSYTGAVSSSYSGWESARKTPVESSSAYSMSVDTSDLEDLDNLDEIDGGADAFSVDDTWDEGESATN
ncbi:MAG: polymer-forming cytoskeletal protein [Caldilineaceae bacterium]|nr:polymer-forming cytoskeletal protein [Caldilineaceae bacterium]